MAYRKILLPLLLSALLISSAVRPGDELATELTDQALANAAITYASARLLNGAISVLKGTEVGVSVGGTVTFTVGEVLDPLHDLIEQLSTVLLVALTSLGIQKVLLEMLASPIFMVLLIVSALGLSASVFLARFNPLLNLAARSLVLLLLLRFSVLVVVLANHWVYQGFLQERYQQANNGLAQAGIELEQQRLEDQNRAVAKDESGMLAMWQEVRGALNPGQRLEAIKRAAEDSLEQALALITVFVLQTVLLPVLFLWGLYRLGGLLARLDYRAGLTLASSS